MPGHPSDSTEQRAAEATLLAGLSEAIGIELAPRTLRLGDTARVVLDGCSEDGTVLAEIYAHLGETKGGQRHKIARDILKMIAVEADQGHTCRKILGFADEAAARYLRGRSWLAETVRTLDIAVQVVELPSDLREGVQRAQARQIMVNP